MSSGRKYPEELKQRAIRLVGEAREQDRALSLHAAVLRIGKLVGVQTKFAHNWNLETFPPRLELEELGGSYALVDDGPPHEWLYHWTPAAC